MAKKTQIYYKDGVGYLKQDGKLVPLKKNAGDTWFKKASYSTINNSQVDTKPKASVADAGTKAAQEARANVHSEQVAEIAKIKAAAMQNSEEPFDGVELPEVVITGHKPSEELKQKRADLQKAFGDNYEVAYGK